MKRILLLTIAALSAITMMAQTPAFPGAEGHGRYVTGGRGGTVIHVTNLNNSGTGSFRAAVSGSSKKIIVFDVAGVIPLASDLTIGDNTTILGQTAPYPGITLRYYTVQPGGNNIIRFIRFRRGQEKDVNDGADASWQRHKTGIIFDHCSFSWSIDEVASFYDNNNFTMQWCTVAESLTNPGHSKGAHGYGGIWGGKLASFHHNMIAHVSNRGPRFNGARYAWTGYTANYDYAKYKWANYVQAENVDFRNCVMYNTQGACYGGPGGGQINIVNNYYKSGPRGSHSNAITKVTVGSSDNSSGYPNAYNMTSRYYISGNTTATQQGVETKNTDWAGVSYDSGTVSKNGDRYSQDPNNLYAADVPTLEGNATRYVRIRMDEPAPEGCITTHTARQAYEKVLAYVGACHYQDNVDARYVNECETGTATYKGSVTGKWGLIDLVADVEGYTELTFDKGSRSANYDTDKDGMPDEWEVKWGLDPQDPSDGKATTMDTLGMYSNLEMYANSLVEDIMMGGCEDGEANYEEYWPALRNLKDVDPQDGENVTITIAKSTYVSSNPSTTWNFTDNDYTVSVSNAKSKSFSSGEQDGVKYSSGAQFTVTLPQDFTLKEVEFKGYDNYATADSYLSEVNGVPYGTTDYVFPKKTADGSYYMVSNIVKTTAKDKFTFTPAGNQIVVSLILKGTFPGSGDIPGDVNGDKVISVADLAMMASYILGGSVDGFNVKVADLNGDGQVSVADLSQLASVILGN